MDKLSSFSYIKSNILVQNRQKQSEVHDFYLEAEIKEEKRKGAIEESGFKPMYEILNEVIKNSEA
ncbi:MAG: hypothetical protein Ta2E_12800 [Mycoplasmoidaceae bacterium]|nr:MAG: hypothetical protein Ta2E_12800 [Mycoplasmoidaceae bacterium]